MRREITYHPAAPWGTVEETGGMKQGLLSPALSQRYPDAGTRAEKEAERRKHVDKWSERAVLSKDISLAGIAVSPPLVL